MDAPFTDSTEADTLHAMSHFQQQQEAQMFPPKSPAIVHVYGPVCDECRAKGYHGKRRLRPHLACYLCGKPFLHHSTKHKQVSR